MSRREPGLTYEGALRILGRRDANWMQHLQGLLGGAVLPTRSLDAIPGTLRGLAGPARWPLVAAAHSTIVVAAYFEALRETLDHRRHSPLGLSEEEKEDKGRIVSKTAKVLFLTPIPAPSDEAAMSPASGYAENKGKVAVWLAALDEAVRAFTVGLAVEQPPSWPDSLQDQAIKRYEAHFLRLAAAVPEFRVWSGLDEIDELGSEDAASDKPAAVPPPQAEARDDTPPVAEDQRAILAALNRSALDRAIVPVSARPHSEHHVVAPALRQIFLCPRYRFALMDSQSWPADERWWAEHPVEACVDERLIELITSEDATRRPILILGHPGAGKSTLTQVLAARLPQTEFTVVYVPLRDVSANAPISAQIQEALDADTGGSVQWTELAKQSQNTVRLVIFDGLDEMLFTSQHDLTHYLQAVERFQHLQSAWRHSVAVIVTSRTVVADRVNIPHGTPVVKLEPFVDQQIEMWLSAWNAANADGIAARRTGVLDLPTALAQRSLAAHPLWLTMLALHAADPHAPALDEISQTVLYERFLRQFAARETAKTTAGLPPQDVDMFAERQLRCLSIAALGMFTRDRLDISAEDLGADLAAWRVSPENPIEAARQVLLKFFFVHAPVDRWERYEFLHAVFGEYLVARLIAEELSYVAQSTVSTPHDARDPDDGVLFPVLAHRVLSTRQPILEFVGEIMTAQLTADERGLVAEALTRLLVRHRYHPGSFISQFYQPIPADHVEQLAAYSANLVLLRLVVDPEPLRLSDVFAPDRRPEQGWRSLLGLWQAGLDEEARESLLRAVRCEDGCLVRTAGLAPGRPDFDAPERPDFDAD